MCIFCYAKTPLYTFYKLRNKWQFIRTDFSAYVLESEINTMASKTEKTVTNKSVVEKATDAVVKTTKTIKGIIVDKLNRSAVISNSQKEIWKDAHEDVVKRILDINPDLESQMETLDEYILSKVTKLTDVTITSFTTGTGKDGVWTQNMTTVKDNMYKSYKTVQEMDDVDSVEYNDLVYIKDNNGKWKTPSFTWTCRKADGFKDVDEFQKELDDELEKQIKLAEEQKAKDEEEKAKAPKLQSEIDEEKKEDAKEDVLN